MIDNFSMEKYPIKYKFDKKKTISWIIALIIIAVLLCLVFVCNITFNRTINVSNYEIVNTDSYKYEIESVERDNSKLTISGYFYTTKEETMIVHNFLILKDEATNKYYKVPTYMIYREDINEESLKEDNYHWAGFESIISSGQGININNNYHLYILSTVNEKSSLVDLDINTGDLK